MSALGQQRNYSLIDSILGVFASHLLNVLSLLDGFDIPAMSYPSMRSVRPGLLLEREQLKRFESNMLCAYLQFFH